MREKEVAEQIGALVAELELQREPVDACRAQQVAGRVELRCRCYRRRRRRSRSRNGRRRRRGSREGLERVQQAQLGQHGDQRGDHVRAAVRLELASEQRAHALQRVREEQPEGQVVAVVRLFQERLAEALQLKQRVAQFDWQLRRRWTGC